MFETNRSALVLAIALTLAPLAGLAGADGPPPAPHSFYGDIEIDGEPAPSGVSVVAQIDGEQRGCLTTGETGSYGGSGGFDPKLVVEGDDGTGGAEITFLVNGVPAEQSATWHSGEVDELNLSVSELGDEARCARTVTDGEDEVTIEAENVPDGETVSASLPSVSVANETDAQVQQLNITAAEPVEQLQLEVRQTPDPPSDVSPPDLEGDQQPVSYVEVEHNVPDQAIAEATFTFEVEDQRLDERSLATEEVVLHHFDGDVWEVLPTEPLAPTDTGQRFQSTTPGFSTFAIAGPAADDGAEDQDDGATGPGGGPASTTADDTHTADVDQVGEASYEITASGVGEDEQLVATFSEPGTDLPLELVELVIHPATDLEDVDLELRLSDGLPATAPSWLDPAPGEPVGTFEIEGSLSEADVDQLEITHEVATTTLDDVDLAADETALYRHTDGEWSALGTQLLEETEETVTFRSNAPGTSWFAAAPSPASQIEIVDREVLEDPVLLGDAGRVLANLENQGSAEGTQELVLTADATPVDETAVILGPGEEITVELSWQPDETGVVDLGLNGEAFATLTVLEDEQLEEAEAPDGPDGEAEPGATGEDGEAWPWMVVGGILAVAILAAAAYRQRG